MYEKLTIKNLRGGLSLAPTDKNEVDEYFDISNLQQEHYAICTTNKPAAVPYTTTEDYDEFADTDFFFKFQNTSYFFSFPSLYYNLGATITKNAAFETFKTANGLNGLLRSAAIFNGVVYLSYNGTSIIKMSAWNTFTLISTVTSATKLIATHGRLYTIYLAGASTVIKYTTDLATFTTVSAPGGVYSAYPIRCFKNPINGDIIYGNLAFDGTNWYEHGLNILALYKFFSSTNYTNEMAGFQEPTKLFMQFEDEFSLSDGHTYTPLRSLSQIMKEKYEATISLIQFYEEYMIISISEGDFENHFTFYKLNTITDKIYKIYEHYFAQPGTPFYDGPTRMIYDDTNFVTIGSDPSGSGHYYSLKIPQEIAYTNDEDHDIIGNGIPTLATQGYFITPPLTFGDPSKETVLKGIVVNTKPLPAGTSVKVYIQNNVTFAWTLVATHDVDDAETKATYFDPCYLFNYKKFKVEFNGTTSLRPELYDVTFIYEKKGL